MAGSATNSSNAEKTGSQSFDLATSRLVYVGFACSRIPPPLIEEFCTFTKFLDLSANQISDLTNLGAFQFLEVLILDGNQLNDHNINIPPLPFLHTLSLNKNQLSNVDVLLRQLQANTPHLSHLSLLGNVACPNQLSSFDNNDEDYQRYRHYVIYQLPRLKFLDSTPVSISESKMSKQVGAFLKTISPHEDNFHRKDESSDLVPIYSPLPQSSVKSSKSGGIYGVSRYVYHGKHSEGNRFICNNDL